MDILKIAAALSKKLYGKKIAFSDSNYFDDKGKIQNYNFSFIDDEEISADKKIRLLTIHKSKGLEADGVLVIVENRKQFFKSWILGNVTR